MDWFWFFLMAISFGGFWAFVIWVVFNIWWKDEVGHVQKPRLLAGFNVKYIGLNKVGVPIFSVDVVYSHATPSTFALMVSSPHILDFSGLQMLISYYIEGCWND